jgi:hydroxyacylglutathione hydrolase
MLKIAKFTFNPLQENTYVLYRDGKAVVIDPGMYHKNEQEVFDQFLEKNNLVLEKIVNTHCHLDHIAGVFYLQNKYKVPFYMPKGELEVLKAAPISAQMYGLQLFQNVEEYDLLENEGILNMAGVEFEILYVPGHSPGHLGFFNLEENVLISGDVLFQGSIGRYDLPGGDLKTLKNSVLNVLFKLPDDTQVLSGHGPTTTIGQEKEYNIIHQL